MIPKCREDSILWKYSTKARPKPTEQTPNSAPLTSKPSSDLLISALLAETYIILLAVFFSFLADFLGRYTKALATPAFGISKAIQT